MTSLTKPNFKNDFQSAAHFYSEKKQADTKPFSIRFTEEERSYLEHQAGGQPLGAFIRALVLCKQAQKRRVSRKPQLHHQKIALVLSTLGDSRLASNLNQLAKHANVGTLNVSEHIEQELHESYLTIISMRDLLIEALGHRA